MCCCCRTTATDVEEKSKTTHITINFVIFSILFSLSLSRARRPLAKKSTFVCYINACVFERVPTSHLSPHAIINCFRERRLGRFFFCAASLPSSSFGCVGLSRCYFGRVVRVSERCTTTYAVECGRVRERTGKEDEARIRRDLGAGEKKDSRKRWFSFLTAAACCCERVSWASLWNENEMFSLLQRRFCRFFLLPLPLYSIAAYMLACLPMVKC